MDVYLEEYTSDAAVARYTSRAAGHGIDYLLKNDYAQVYLSAIENYLRVPRDFPLRLLEFGCGGGMNIITLVSMLEERGRTIELAVGSDFSDKLIAAANRESQMLLRNGQREKMRFVVARNETLSADLARGLQFSSSALQGYFHLIIGVNTFRYCHRLNKANKCAQDISGLLKPGGICVMIDMNQRFPAFRSKFRDAKTKPAEERYLPSLEEYASPFRQARLEVLRQENFCWIPHSAGPLLTRACRFAAPILNVVAKSRAMRSLVVSRKPS